MPEAAKIQVTEDVAADINRLTKRKYTLNEFKVHVGHCFSTVDFSDPPCQQCSIQAVCCIYRGDRLGVSGIREEIEAASVVLRIGDDGMPERLVTPDSVVRKIAEASGQAVPGQIPEPPAPKASPSAPVAPPPPIPQALPPLPGVVKESTHIPAVSAPTPPPEPESPKPPAALIPADGSAPDGWTAFSRVALVKMCHELGYSKKDTNFIKEKRLVKMIFDKKPEWATPSNGGSTNSGVKEVEAQADAGRVTDSEIAAADAARLSREDQRAADLAAQARAAIKSEGSQVSILKTSVAGSAKSVANWLIEHYGDAEVEVEVIPTEFEFGS